MQRGFICKKFFPFFLNKLHIIQLDTLLAGMLSIVLTVISFFLFPTNSPLEDVNTIRNSMYGICKHLHQICASKSKSARPHKYSCRRYGWTLKARYKQYILGPKSLNSILIAVRL